MAALNSRCGHYIFAVVSSLWPPYGIGQFSHPTSLVLLHYLVKQETQKLRLFT